MGWETKNQQERAGAKNQPESRHGAGLLSVGTVAMK